MATYNKDEDYKALMDAAAAKGDYAAAAKYEQQRNAKIAGEGMNYAQTSDYAKYLNSGSGSSAKSSSLNYDPNTDYNAKARTLYSSGDYSGAYDALFGGSNSREAKLASTGNNYGETSQSIWDSLVKEYGADPNLQYKSQIEAMLQEIQDRPSYSYEPSEWDILKNKLAQGYMDDSYEKWLESDQYRSLADRYGRTGQKNMQDVLGQMSARTGGLASSYAENVAQQQYNDYMGMLEDVARKAYSNERSDMLDRISLADTMGKEEYQRYLDSLNRGDSDRSYALSLIDQIMGINNDADDRKYSREQTAKSDAQNRVYDYLTNKGGSWRNLDADLITASGYTTAELNQMEQAYKDAQAAAAAKAKTGSGSNSTKTTPNYFGDMYNNGIKTRGQAINWLVSSGMKIADAEKMADLYMDEYKTGSFEGSGGYLVVDGTLIKESDVDELLKKKVLWEYNDPEKGLTLHLQRSLGGTI